MEKMNSFVNGSWWLVECFPHKGEGPCVTESITLARLAVDSVAGSSSRMD